MVVIQLSATGTESTYSTVQVASEDYNNERGDARLLSPYR